MANGDRICKHGIYLSQCLVCDPTTYTPHEEPKERGGVQLGFHQFTPNHQEQLDRMEQKIDRILKLLEGWNPTKVTEHV